MERYNIEVLGLSEVRWNTFGRQILNTGQRLLYSGKENEDDPHEAGVGFMLSKKACKSLIEWEPVSDRIITARLDSHFKKTTIIQCYAPTNAPEEEKIAFYDALQATIDKVPRSDVSIVLGDMNAKVGEDNSGREENMGKHGVGSLNENGELFADFCVLNNLVIGGSIFPHKRHHKSTWISPDGRTENQIDHFAISRRWRTSMQDVRVKRGADAASDHHLLVAEVKIKLLSHKRPRSGRHQYDVSKLKDPQCLNEFHLVLQNRFEALYEVVQDHHQEDEEDQHQNPQADQPEQQTSGAANRKWKVIKQAYAETCDKVLGKASHKRKNWISSDTWNKMDERRKLKEKLNQAVTRQQKRQAQREYSEKDMEVKRSCKNDKRTYANNLTRDAEEAARKGDIKTLYNITRRLSGQRRTMDRPIRDNTGSLLTNLNSQLEEWRNHFATVLNRDPPVDPPELQVNHQLPINTGNITKEGIKRALTRLKNGKAAGSDNIPPEALKAGGQTSIDILYDLFNTIWTTEEIPEDWLDGLLVNCQKRETLAIAKIGEESLCCPSPVKCLAVLCSKE
jgi:hypothetical protein